MAEGTPPRDAPPGVSPVRATTPGASPGARAPDAIPPSAVPETPPDSRFGSPVAADALAPGGASPTIRGDKFALTSPQSADSPASPHLTQGAPGHVARVVDWAEREAQGELLSAEKPTRTDTGPATPVGGAAQLTEVVESRLPVTTVLSKAQTTSRSAGKAPPCTVTRPPLNPTMAGVTRDTAGFDTTRIVVEELETSSKTTLLGYAPGASGGASHATRSWSCRDASTATSPN